MNIFDSSISLQLHLNQRYKCQARKLQSSMLDGVDSYCVYDLWITGAERGVAKIKKYHNQPAEFIHFLIFVIRTNGQTWLCRLVCWLLIKITFNLWRLSSIACYIHIELAESFNILYSTLQKSPFIYLPISAIYQNLPKYIQIFQRAANSLTKFKFDLCNKLVKKSLHFATQIWITFATKNAIMNM